MKSLIINEYIKLLKKKSICIGLFIMVISSIILIVGVKIYCDTLNINSDYNKDYYSKERYEDEIEYYNKNKPKGYEVKVEYYKSLIKNKINNDDWKNKALNQAYNSCYIYLLYSEESDISQEELDRYEKNFKQLIDAVDNNNYMLYFEYMQEIKNIENSYKFEGCEKAINNIYTYMINNRIRPDSQIYTILNNIDEYQSFLECYCDDYNMQDEYKIVKDKWLIELYRLDNNVIRYITDSLDTKDILKKSDSFYKYLLISKNLTSLISFFMVLISSSIVASEYSQGTIKFLFMKPLSRTKIFFSKLITIVTFSIGCILGIFIINSIVSGFVSGFEGINMVCLYVDREHVKEDLAIKFILKVYFFEWVKISIISIITFSISTLSKKTTIATGIGMICLICSKILVNFFVKNNFNWGRHLIFLNWELLNISKGEILFINHSLKSAIINLFLHLCVFILMAHDSFVKNEI